MDKKQCVIQKTLFGEQIIESYYGENVNGEIIKIPNFQPLVYDDNPRLDSENVETKRKNKEVYDEN